jgi:hypothetical protein
MHMLGVVRLQQRRTGDGIALIRQAIAVNGEVASAHVDLGKAPIAERHPDEALAVSIARLRSIPPDRDPRQARAKSSHHAAVRHRAFHAPYGGRLCRHASAA